MPGIIHMLRCKLAGQAFRVHRSALQRLAGRDVHSRHARSCHAQRDMWGAGLDSSPRPGTCVHDKMAPAELIKGLQELSAAAVKASAQPCSCLLI